MPSGAGTKKKKKKKRGGGVKGFFKKIKIKYHAKNEG